MKKFVAVLLPIILIGSMFASFAVSAACPTVSQNMDTVSRPALNALNRTIWYFGQDRCFNILPIQCGVPHWDGSLTLRCTPAGDELDGKANDCGTIPRLIPGGGGALSMVVTCGEAIQAWTNNQNPNDVWLPVRWVDHFGVPRQGYVHFRHLVEIDCPEDMVYPDIRLCS